MKRFLQNLFFITILALTTCCNSAVKENCHPSVKKAAMPMPVTELNIKEITEQLPSRKEDFSNTLETQITINGIQNHLSKTTGNTSTIFDINIIFKNISGSELIIRYPQTIGFISDPNISGGAIYDLTLHLRTNDDIAIGAWNGFTMLDEDQVGLSDFMLLEENRALCVHVSLTMPPIFLKETGYSSLPVGKYYLSAEYENHMIGFSVPLLETPPPNLNGIEEMNWQFAHKTQVDLDAWVGRLWSPKTTFKILE
jgi:hypothetical protein